MKVAYIVCENYLTPDGNGMSVGGIQTYLTNLIPLFQNEGYKIHLYQKSLNDFESIKGDITITGVANTTSKKEYVKCIRKIILNQINQKNDLLLFGCDTLIFESKGLKSIAIQHGITWDIPVINTETRFRYLGNFLIKTKLAWQTLNRVSGVRTLVCVDYNFINWYRAVAPRPLIKFAVIPNFTNIPQEMPKKQDGNINIIFARRFWHYRGTRIFAAAIEPLLKERSDLTVTIAGEGPDATYLHEKLDCYSQVSFIKYSSSESLAIHADKHIAVVPTLGSEGTSLSLLEAMASGCAVICTNIGGMTNIVLDHYNGLIVNPDESDLRNSLKELIINPELRNRLSEKAFETVTVSFSIDKWRQSWRNVIESMNINTNL